MDLSVVKLIYIFLATPDEVQSNPSDNCLHHYNVEILNLFNPESQLINTKPGIKIKFKKLLSELKQFEVQKILILDCKKIIGKFFILCAKLIANDSDIDEAFIHTSKHYDKRKNYADKDWIVLDVLINHKVKVFECFYKQKKWE